MFEGDYDAIRSEVDAYSLTLQELDLAIERIQTIDTRGWNSIWAILHDLDELLLLKHCLEQGIDPTQYYRLSSMYPELYKEIGPQRSDILLPNHYPNEAGLLRPYPEATSPHESRPNVLWRLRKAGLPIGVITLDSQTGEVVNSRVIALMED